MEDMFYAIIGLAFIITLAVLAQKRRNKHFTKKCPKCGYPTVHILPVDRYCIKYRKYPLW